MGGEMVFVIPEGRIDFCAWEQISMVIRMAAGENGSQ